MSQGSALWVGANGGAGPGNILMFGLVRIGSDRLGFARAAKQKKGARQKDSEADKSI
jgi:hypothetical protein